MAIRSTLFASWLSRWQVLLRICMRPSQTSTLSEKWFHMNASLKLNVRLSIQKCQRSIGSGTFWRVRVLFQEMSLSSQKTAWCHVICSYFQDLALSMNRCSLESLCLLQKIVFNLFKKYTIQAIMTLQKSILYTLAHLLFRQEVQEIKKFMGLL